MLLTELCRRLIRGRISSPRSLVAYEAFADPPVELDPAVELATRRRVAQGAFAYRCRCTLTQVQA
jgi:hypothetical protein